MHLINHGSNPERDGEFNHFLLNTKGGDVRMAAVKEVLFHPAQISVHGFDKAGQHLFSTSINEVLLRENRKLFKKKA